MVQGPHTLRPSSAAQGISREPDGKWNRWDLNRCPHEMLCGRWQLKPLHTVLAQELSLTTQRPLYPKAMESDLATTANDNKTGLRLFRAWPSMISADRSRHA